MRVKKETVYKLCLAIIIAVFVFAMYLNTIEMIESRFNRTPVSAGLTGAAEEQGGADEQVAAGQDGGAGRAFNFTLYDRAGGGVEFTKYRGDIVFLVFWTPLNAASIQTLTELQNRLAGQTGFSNTGTAVENAESPGVSLVSVCVPGDYDITDGAASHDIDALIRFVDATGELTNLFLVTEYPSVYVFYPDGKLCDYRVGGISDSFINDMIEKAAEIK